MLPRWHVVLGAIFALAAFHFFSLSYFEAFMIFFSSVFIDFDHYVVSAWRNKALSLRKSFRFYEEQGRESAELRKKGIKRKLDLQIFHTLEFHLFILACCFVYPLLFFVLIGMVFHSLTDIVWMGYNKNLYERWFFLSSWIVFKLRR